MQSEGKNKNDIFYLIVLVLTLITMAVGITFTFLSLETKDKEDSTKIKTGTLSISYVDGDAISGIGLIPRDEPTFNTDFAVYKKRFSIRSNGTLDQSLDIYLNVTKNDFKDGNLKYSLYNSENRKISTGSIPSSGNVLIAKDDYLKNNFTNNYTILIWLQNTDDNQEYEEDSIFVGGFDITANQVKYK